MKLHTINRFLRRIGLVVVVSTDPDAEQGEWIEITLERAKRHPYVDEIERAKRPGDDYVARLRAKLQAPVPDRWSDPRATCAYCPTRTTRNAKGECTRCGGTAMEIR